jgi:hypothetical protein
MVILESKPPNNSLIRIEIIDLDTVALIFPESNRYYPAILALLMGIGISLWQWQNFIRIFQLDLTVWEERGVIRGFFLAVMSLVFGIAAILSHTRVTLTNDSVCRSWNTAGINFFRFQAKFKNIKNIVTDNDTANEPIIKVYSSDKKFFAIADFDHIEERDWLAGELIRIWRNSIASNDVPPTP